MIKVNKTIYYNLLTNNVVVTNITIVFKRNMRRKPTNWWGGGGDNADDIEEEKKKWDYIFNKTTTLKTKNENKDKDEDEDKKEKDNEDEEIVSGGEEDYAAEVNNMPIITNNSMNDDLLNFIQQHPYSIVITLMCFGMLFYYRITISESIRNFFNYTINIQTEQTLTLNNDSNIEGDYTSSKQIEQQQDNQSKTAELDSDSKKIPKSLNAVSKPSKLLIINVKRLIKWVVKFLRKK